MRRAAFIILLSIVCISQVKAQQYYFPIGKARKPSSLDTQQYYFPLFRSGDGLMPDTATVIRRSAQLKALGEPIIFYNNNADRIIRFTWLRSNDQPIAIRLVMHNGHTTIYWKECDGTGSGKPGKLITNKQKNLDNSDWRHFRKLALQINTCKPDTSTRNTAGTAEWLLEGAMGGFYQIDDVTSPGPASILYKCGDYLIGLTDLAIPAERKY